MTTVSIALGIVAVPRALFAEIAGSIGSDLDSTGFSRPRHQWRSSGRGLRKSFLVSSERGKLFPWLENVR
jgi:hypothetical protein